MENKIQNCPNSVVYPYWLLCDLPISSRKQKILISYIAGVSGETHFRVGCFTET